MESFKESREPSPPDRVDVTERAAPPIGDSPTPIAPSPECLVRDSATTSGPGAGATFYRWAIRILNKVFLPLFHIWVAGERVEQAIRETKKLNSRHPEATTIINFLGEHYTEGWKVERTVEEYFTAIDKIADSGVKASVSLKPSQMGFDLPMNGEQTAAKNMTAIVDKGKSRGLFVWMDMEHTGYTELSLSTYREWLKDRDNAGIVLQANIRRTMADLQSLISLDRSAYPVPPKLRLCKGIYKESPDVSYTKKEDVNRNFGILIKTLIEEAPRDVWVAIASHDTIYIDKAIELGRETPHDFFEIQMLRGVHTELQQELLERGERLAIYTPYGEDSLAYSVRRATKANNLTATIIRSLLSGVYRKVYKK